MIKPQRGLKLYNAGCGPPTLRTPCSQLLRGLAGFLIQSGSDVLPASICWRAEVANERVKSVDNFTYLGSDLDSSGFCSPDILCLIGISSWKARQRLETTPSKSMDKVEDLQILCSADSLLLHEANTWTDGHLP